MKFYLSSYRIGEHGDKLAELASSLPLAIIPNALDCWSSEDTKDTRSRNEDDLKRLDVAFETLDLRDFFSNKSKLPSELSNFSGVWVTGGNTFVLRQAMNLSGFEQTISKMKHSSSFLYGGYSAGICVLAPNLRALQVVDDPNQFPYTGQTETIWEGLNILDYIILPHYKSDHPESDDIDKEIEFCESNGIRYRTLQDGEVLFGEDIRAIRKDC